MSRETVAELTETLGTTLGKSASRMDGLVVPNFGIFEPKLRQERVAVHPGTGKQLLVPPRITLAFKCSPALKQRLNNGK